MTNEWEKIMILERGPAGLVKSVCIHAIVM